MGERLRLGLDEPSLLGIRHRSAGGQWAARPVCRLWLRSEGGAVGLGELAPLPGYSKDSFEEGLSTLRELAACFEAVWDGGASPIEWVIQLERMVPEHLPAARFALACAALDWLGKRLNIPAWKLVQLSLAENQAAKRRGEGASWEAPAVQLSALLPQGLGHAELLEQLDGLMARGYRNFKLKLGYGAHHSAQGSVIGGLLDELWLVVDWLDKKPGGNKTCLRVDANQGLRPEQLSEVFQALSRAGVELIEEPCREDVWLDWLARGQRASVPVALDESLFNDSEIDLKWLLARGARGLILKPTCLGFERCLKLYQLARTAGLWVSLSHCFEAALGYRGVATLALALESTLPCGLAPHSALSDDHSVQCLVRQGHLHAWGEPGLGFTENDMP